MNMKRVKKRPEQIWYQTSLQRQSKISGKKRATDPLNTYFSQLRIILLKYIVFLN